MLVARSSLRRQTLPRLLSVRCWKSGDELAGLGRRRATTSSDETAGLGVSVDVEGVGRTSLMKSMMNTIDMPERFLPVTSVSVRAAIGHAASEGALWRRLVLDGTPMTDVKQSLIRSNISVPTSSNRILYSVAAISLIIIITVIYKKNNK